MKYSIIGSALVAGAVATVAPRAGLACEKLEGSVIAEPQTNTAEEFQRFKPYSDMARAANAPKGYERTFFDKDAAVKANDDKYMQYANLASYDVNGCAQMCDQLDGCQAFNIYIHRSPEVEPAAGCPNPTANALVSCALYNKSIKIDEMINIGQSRGPVDAKGEAFKVVVRASNVYEKLAPIDPALCTLCPGMLRRSHGPKTVTVTDTVTSTVFMGSNATSTQGEAKVAMSKPTVVVMSTHNNTIWVAPTKPVASPRIW